MKTRTAFLTVLIALALTAWTACSKVVTPSQNRVGYSAWNTQVSYTHCDPLPKTGKPEFVRGTWEMNDGILQHTACEDPCIGSTFTPRIDSHHGGKWNSLVGKP